MPEYITDTVRRRAVFFEETAHKIIISILLKDGESPRLFRLNKDDDTYGEWEEL